MDRIMVFNRLDAYLCDLDPKKVHGLRSVEEVNGEHALTITTTHQLEKTNRIVLKDGTGHWHEYVVTGIVDSHETDEGLVTEYYCVWSIQYDLSGTFVDNQYGCGIVPGHASVPHPVQDALTIALSTTNRWQIGTVNVTSMAAASFYRRSGWEAIQTVIEKWGGELQATIDVGQGGVVARHVDLLEHVGASSATRRFDYGHDVASIKRTVSDEVWPCRIIPLGASQETDEGGYTRRPTIESVNSGVMWLEDADAVPLTRMPDGNGGWEYPTVIVENDTYEVPADLKAWAIANITDYTRPRVTYEASVVQLARAGMNPHGVALGDEVVVVDREFGGDGLRITARVVRQDCNLLDPTDTELTIGNITDKLSGQLADLSRQVSEVAEQVASASSFQSSTEYVLRLLNRINNEANATGGFTYITEGQGIRTYDVAVTDPLVGTEASSVVEVKGGTIRIANTKTAQGQWEWKTIFTSGYVNAEVIRAIGLLTGSHVEVDTNGVHIYDQNGTEVALYAPTVRIGATTDGNYITVDTDSLDVYHGGTNMATFGQTTRIGPSNGTRVVVSGSTVKIIPENRTRNALTFGANATEDYAYISYGTDTLSIGPLDIGDIADLQTGDIWLTDSLRVGGNMIAGEPNFYASASGQVGAAGAIYATLEPTDDSKAAGLVGTASYIYLRDGYSSTKNRWRFGRQDPNGTTGRDDPTIAYSDGSSWYYIAPMPAITAAISGQTDKALTTSYANLTLGAVTTVASGLAISDGGIKCAKGGRVMLSASAYFEGINDGNVCNIRLLIGSTVAAFVSNRGGSDRCQMVVPPRITTVAAGDVLYMAVANTSSATGHVKGSRIQTWMTVQYVAYNIE